MKLNNGQMDAALGALAPLLEKTGKVGYAAARNKRRLQDQLVEFAQAVAVLGEEYGERKEDGTWSVPFDSPRFPEFAAKYEELASITHKVELMPLKVSEVMDALDGNAMDALWFLLEDDYAAC